MWSVSDQFLRALRAPHQRVTVVTASMPDGPPAVLEIQSGSVSVTHDSTPRRTADMTVAASPAEFQSLITPGTAIKIMHGINLGSSTELVPVFSGGIVDGSQELGDGTASCRLADDGAWLARTNFVSPYSPTSSQTRAAVIAAIVQDSKPGTIVINRATDIGRVGSVVWDSSRVDAIRDLCRDGGMVAYFQPDGTFLIRDAPTINSAAVWTIAAGDGGTLKSASRDRTLDRMYNTVVVRPSASDGSQNWVQQIAQVTDLNHPRHPSKIGVVPYIWATPTTGSAVAALAAARLILDRVLGTSETLSIGAVANPALEAGDVVRVVSPTINTQPAAIFQHFLDSFQMDLLTGDMSGSTRSQEEIDA